MNVARFAKDNARVIVFSVIFITLAGLYSITALPSGIYPEVEFPRIAIVAHSGDLSPRIPPAPIAELEGLRVGFAQARAAVDAIVSGDPASYERAWVRATRYDRMLTSGLVAVARSPMRRAIVPAASALPTVFGSVIERLAR